ncbi:PD-(D/E)XK nuclease family protein [Sphingomonas sp.]|uniref:PD-(D/E)XK nuclease family protein n=1 Tax=Sphingomonas sp. TaxID=28214 RepID=UPI003BA9AE59
MSEEFIPTLTHATERDIDLMLVEELYASPAFIGWLAARGGASGTIKTSTVLHSKRRTRSRREIDIFVDLLLTDGGKAALLIENKLDASEQPDQAESYREELHRISGDYPTAAMLIVCPDSYAREHKAFTEKFDAVITYEEVAKYFDGLVGRTTGEPSARARFRRDILNQAVNKHRRGYTPIPNEIVGDFNARYVRLLSEVAPAIKPGKSMLKPANPDESTSMIFDHAASLAALPSNVRPTRFAHELGRGQEHRANYVAVTFGGWGAALPLLKPVIEQDLAELSATVFAKPPTKVRPNPGLTIACATPPVDNQQDFAVQRNQLVAGIRRALDLQDWLRSNISRLSVWKTLAEQHRTA